MKKIVVFFSVVFFLTSCSSGDDSNSNLTPIDPSEVLLKRIVSHNLGEIYETILTYNGKKLVKTDNSRQRHEFTYSGDQIVKIQTFIYPSNTLFTYFDLEYYADGRLKKVKKYFDGPITLDFTYNSDGTVSYFRTVDYNTSLSYGGTISMQNNEIQQATITSGAPPRLAVFQYDNKNHPMKNITGYDKLVLFQLFYPSLHSSGFSTAMGINHNQTSVLDLDIQSTPLIFNVYQYNSNNFPISINGGDPDSDYLFYE